jgi:hypothetical protein
MTVRVQLPSVGRYDLFQHVRTHDITVWEGDRLHAHVFPAVVSRPDWDWFVKEAGEDAQRFPTQEAALAYVTGQPSPEEDQ